ncbi:MAG: YdcF family protein [Bacteroidia bacterium]|nr:YdcF family protein [Methylotenera sp.]
MKFAVKTLGAILLVYLLAMAAIVYDGLNDNVFKADLIIVPGNKVELDGKACPRLQARLNEAIEIYNQGQTKSIFVSGGFGKEGFDEATVMSEYLIQHGISQSVIVTDSLGIDIMATAKNASVFMKKHHFTSAIVVTQYFHVSRTKLALKKMGISSIGNAHARFVELRDIYSLAREVIGYITYLGKNA